MAEENHQEQAPHGNEARKEEKPKSTLESVIGELGSFAKKSLVIGALAAMPFGYNYIDPSHVARAAVTTTGFAAAKATTNIIQEKDPFDGIVRNGFNGALLSYPIAEGFKGLNSLENVIEPSYGTAAAKVAKGAAMASGLQPAITAGNVALNYGLGGKFRKNIWPTLKKSFKLIAIPGVLNVTYLYKFGLFVQMCVSASLSYLLNYSQAAGESKGNMKHLYTALNPFSYVSAGATASSKLVRNTTKGIYDSVYAIGSSISDLYKTKPAQSARPATGQPEPAQHPA